jgi:hypothetical protein
MAVSNLSNTDLDKALNAIYFFSSLDIPSTSDGRTSVRYSVNSAGTCSSRNSDDKAGAIIGDVAGRALSAFAQLRGSIQIGKPRPPNEKRSCFII